MVHGFEMIGFVFPIQKRFKTPGRAQGNRVVGILNGGMIRIRKVPKDTFRAGIATAAASQSSGTDRTSTS